LLGCGSGLEKYYITEGVISDPCDNYCLCWGAPSNADSPLVGEDLLGGDPGFPKGKVKVCEGEPADRDQKRKLGCRYGAVSLPIFAEDIEAFNSLVDGGMKKVGRLLRWAWSEGMLVLYMDLSRRQKPRVDLHPDSGKYVCSHRHAVQYSTYVCNMQARMPRFKKGRPCVSPKGTSLRCLADGDMK
jgi:hypothetical protein